LEERRLNDVAQSRTLDIGHREILPRAMLTGGVDGHDVRVVQLSQNTLFAQEPLLGSWRQLAITDFERHATAQGELHGLVHDAHTTEPELADNMEIRQLRKTGQAGVRRRLMEYLVDDGFVAEFGR